MCCSIGGRGDGELVGQLGQGFRESVAIPVDLGPLATAQRTQLPMSGARLGCGGVPLFSCSVPDDDVNDEGSIGAGLGDGGVSEVAL